MDDLISPLVLTKLRVPIARPRNILRTHLLNRLNSEAGTGFILVCAPAGYGKTTLLAEWSQSLLENGVAVAWYGLDPGDDDPIPFGAYFVASLAQALGPTPELARITQLLRASPELDLQKILPAIVNAIVASDRDCVIILDDYHLIGSPVIHSGIAFLLEHLPENLRVAIGSRSDPPLPLARLRVRGQLLEIRASGLRFTADETALFLHEIMHLDLSQEMAATLEARTEGWIAGLQLAAIVLQGELAALSQQSSSGYSGKKNLIDSFTGSHRYLVEYLMEEVVSRQPEGVQSFLLSTSILERMSAPLCDAILGKDFHSEAILKQLEQANLFIVALDDQEHWYRYHHLFRNFLQTRLNKIHPERINLLHQSACEWLAVNGNLREAAAHAFQTKDWEYAAAFVEQYSLTLIVHSDISTIYEWCSAFPEAVMQAHPMLCILQGMALAYNFQRQNRDRVEARLQQADRLMVVIENKQLARELNEFAAVVRTFLAFAPDPDADPQELLAATLHMLSDYPEGDPGQFSGLLMTGYAYMALHDVQAADQAFESARQIALREHLYFGIVESTFHLARLAHCQGRLQRAVEICRQGQADIAAMLVHPEQELPAVGCLDIALGCVQMEQDQLDAADQLLRQGLDLMGGGMNPYYKMTACVALFRLREIQGRSVEALEFLSRLEESWPDFSFCAHGLRLAHALRKAPGDPGTLDEVAAWCQRFSPSLGENVHLPGIGPFGAAETYYLAYLAWARAQVSIGKPQAALVYIERQLDQARAHDLVDRVIELSLLEAQARQALGDEQHTWAALERALSAAQPAGYIRDFDQGPALTRLLVEAARRGICRDYVGQVLAATGMSQTSDLGHERSAARSAQMPYDESLSERELEVLRLMARGASNHAIAGQLVITVGTVKSHINHILGKLDAHNRTEAVAKARGLGLLDF